MYCISISHKTAPVEIRERFAFSRQEQQEFEQQVILLEAIKECVVLSTCNRNELYFSGEDNALEVMEEQIAEYKGVKLENVLKYYRIFQEERAIYHLHQVTCGFDSMVLGEDEILRQVKEAYECGKEVGATGFQLNRAFQSAFACSKRIKTDTLLSKLPISVGTLVANEIFHYPTEVKNVLIIGINGKMGSIIMKNIYNRDGVNVTGTLRRHNKELEIHYPQVQFVPYDQRYEAVADADIIISATASPHFTIVKENLNKCKMQEKNHLFIDLAVPMDIDKEITKLPGVRLFDIDYFRILSRDNNNQKVRELETGNKIIEEQVEELLKELAFHKKRALLEQLFEQCKGRDFQQIFYELRDCCNYEEFQCLIHVLEKAAEEEG
ncbi:MAG: glutamyl-tRNA reductase [Lachnospiraceae bacterium]